jgi:uncharacterized protein YxjI
MTMFPPPGSTNHAVPPAPVPVHDAASGRGTLGLPPPANPPAAGSKPSKRPRRPPFAAVAGAAIALRLLRQFAGQIGGVWAVLGLGALVWGTMLTWRWRQRAKVAANGTEHTAAEIREQLAKAGDVAPAFPEDGTLLGASVVVVNQRSKLLEVNTQYDLYGSDGKLIGHVGQIGQTRAKQVARVLTSFDQFFTHHFDVTDASGATVLRITRPRKWFRTKVHVFDGYDRFVGSIVQQNVFGKIRFALVDAAGTRLGALDAENWRAWDFAVRQASGLEVARVTKTWEGWVRTYATTADHYVVRVHHRLGDPLRSLVLATALSVDLALKQDARGLG